jgi:hypothetical protein
MDRRPTWRWLVTCFELAVGGVCALVPVAGFVIGPQFTGSMAPTFVGLELDDALLIACELAMLVGLTWMVRISRRGAEDGPPSIWRYRDW